MSESPFFGNYGQADDEVVNRVLTDINTIVDARDLELLGKLVSTGLSAITHVLHAAEPGACKTDPNGFCPHQSQIRAVLSYSLASAFAHRMFGLAEMASLIKAAATATALSVEFQFDGDIEMSPYDVLENLQADFNTAGWDKIKQDLLNIIAEQRVGVDDAIEDMQQQEDYEQFFPQLTPDEVLDMIERLRNLPEAERYED